MDSNYWVKSGNKILNAFFTLESKESKLERALASYRQALNNFIESKDYLSYALLSEKIGDEYYKLANDFDALTHWTNAQTHYANFDADSYLEISNKKIIPCYVRSGKIDRIAKCYYQIAKKLNADYDNGASEYYEQAINYYESIGTGELMSCYSDYAYYLLECEQIDKSVTYLEKKINLMMDNNLLSKLVNPFIFTLLLCVLTKNDVVAINNKITEYCNIAYTFIDSREHKFILKITECCESYNMDTFLSTIDEFEQIQKLKPHEVKLLLIIKNNIISANECDLT